ncbi:DUF4097 family beta strand repeat protein [Kangiella sp. HZ709]|uniref:DUF4097 family beta strand repeat protein n=1 Tax=Kangiella sp. HZ709 TaxID=2666328 RepID=UPI0012B076A9|nr:DUF4097 family beta strand repeat protein [Kangiella sp. HZ709]MRX27361.1 DUF4097 family beta strand repeat protein [Kangiella sp. HZ709]
MRNLISSIALISTLGFSSNLFALQDTKELNLAASSLKSFFIDSGAGSLEVVGKPNLNQIQVTADIYVEGLDEDDAQEWFEDNMKLTLQESRGRATLKATFKSNSSFFGWNKEKKIDLTVYMPENLELEVDDGSGWAKISDIKANVMVDDGSGSLDIANIQGSLKVEDGSGSLSIENVDGDLWVDDGSGKLVIDQVTGKADIDDGSGSLKISNIGKNVYIVDGSGSIEACNIDNKLTIDDGSGSVKTCSDFKGELVLK